jgi:hypothetical protein
VQRCRTEAESAEVTVKRIHFIEIADEPWCPQAVKDGVTDFCRFILDVSRFYKPAAPLLECCAPAGASWPRSGQ